MPIPLDVIVRTKVDASRSNLLFRALDSIQSQGGIAARPIVVINGSEVDAETLASLESRPGILLHRIPEASAALARSAGRKLVTAPYFSYLDDDDELIAGSLLEPVSWLEKHRECDVLINNGWFVRPGGVLLESTHISDHVDDPGLGLLSECWLSPGACVFRSDSIPIGMLDSRWSNLEWTYIAFELCAERKRLHFMDVPTVRYNDTPGSMSKETRQHEAALDLLQLFMGDIRLGAKVRRAAYRKYLRSLHDLAWHRWQQGQYARAWHGHLSSLRPPYTFRYLLFTRKLLWPARGTKGNGRSLPEG